MQTKGHVAMAVSLLVAAVMVLSVGMGIVSLAAGASASPAKAPATALAAMPNIAAATAYLHQGMPKLISTPAAKAGGASSKGTTYQYGSYNWAGYADNVSSSAFGTVLLAQGEWFIPTATCPTSGHAKGTYSATWVGIDGFATGSVEQAGTFAYCSGPNVAPDYYVWWEFYPYNDVQFTSLVSAGDLVQVTISYNPTICYSGDCGVYTLSLQDFDTPAVDFQIGSDPAICNSNAQCETGSDGSAECISEAPGIGGSYNGGYADLTKQTPTTFYMCADTISTVFDGIGSHGSHASLDEITEYGYTSGKKIQTDSGLSTYYYGKSKFTITWHGYV